MDFPDEFLPPIQVGLPDYVDLGRAFLDEGTAEGVEKFINLVMSGRLQQSDDIYRVLLNARQGAVIPQIEDCTITLDFDSLQAVTPDLPLTCPLSIYPVPDFKYTLKKPVHITFPIRIQEVIVVI